VVWCAACKQIYIYIYILVTVTDEFKREDLVRTVLEYIVQDLVNVTQLVCRCHGIKRVFFSGGFCCTPLVRGIITAEYVRRNVSSFLQGQVWALPGTFACLYASSLFEIVRVTRIWRRYSSDLMQSASTELRATGLIQQKG